MTRTHSTLVGNGWKRWDFANKSHPIATGATNTLKLPELNRFRALYNGLRLDIRETFTVEFSRERLGFFQVCALGIYTGLC